MSIESDVLVALEALGATKEEVANTLKAKGIKGYPYKQCQCPIAMYLTSCGFNEVHVFPSSDDNEGLLRARGIPEGYEMPLPRAVSDFAYRFDCGDFPELEDTWPGSLPE